MSEFIFSLSEVGKVTPRGRTILSNINLSFFPGAKIGVLGLNGSGKSTLLRIIAGVDKEHLGEMIPAKEIRIGFLSQEPVLDAEKTVRENIDEGVAPIRAILTEFDAVNQKFAEEMTGDEMDALLQKQADLQDQIEAAGAWELDHEIDVAMDSLRVPEGDLEVTNLSGGERRRPGYDQSAHGGDGRARGATLPSGALPHPPACRQPIRHEGAARVDGRVDRPRLAT